MSNVTPTSDAAARRTPPAQTPSASAPVPASSAPPPLPFLPPAAVGQQAAGQPVLSAPRIDQETLIEILQALNLQVLDSQMVNEQGALKIEKDRIQSNREEQLRKIQELARKIAHRKKSSKIGKIFTWVGVAVAVLVAAIVAVVGVVTAQPELVIAAIAAATLVITLTVLNETGTMNKIVNALASAIEKSLIADGMDPKKARLAAQIMAQITVAAVIILLEIGLVVMTGGADTEELVSTVARVAANIALKTAAFVQAGAAIGEGAADIAAGVYQYQATQTQADQEKNKAELAKLEALLEEEQETLKEIVQAIEQSEDAMTEISRSVSQGKQRMIEIASAV